MRAAAPHNHEVSVWGNMAISEGLTLSWGMRYFGDPDIRAERRKFEKLLEGSANGEGFCRIRDDKLPALWRREIASVFRKLEQGRLKASGKHVLGAAEAVAIEGHFWARKRATLLSATDREWERDLSEKYYDIRLLDGIGLPIAVAAECYGQDEEWRVAADYDSECQIPTTVGAGMIFHRSHFGLLFCRPDPTPEQTERLRANMVQEIAAGRLSLWNDSGDRVELVPVLSQKGEALDWNSSSVSGVVVRVRQSRVAASKALYPQTPLDDNNDVLSDAFASAHITLRSRLPDVTPLAPLREPSAPSSGETGGGEAPSRESAIASVPKQRRRSTTLKADEGALDMLRQYIRSGKATGPWNAVTMLIADDKLHPDKDVPDEAFHKRLCRKYYNKWPA
jgi:hypothetical protein